MRQKKDFLREKLLPLRKFSAPGIYSAQYLSQLVQRKKLKATKIGRNYYTTEEWFFDYLNRHANDKKQKAYLKYFTEKRQAKIEFTKEQEKFFNLTDKKNNKLNFYVLPENEKNLVLSKSKIKPINMAIAMAIFVFLIIMGNIFYISNFRDEGRVAGEESQFSEGMGTSTIKINKDY